MHLLFRSIVLGSLLAVTAFAVEPPVHAAVPPWSERDWTVESGLLWNVGTGTPIAYRIVPLQLSWRSRAALNHEFADGSRLVVRHRLTLLGDWIQHGPESIYAGFAASPSLEWWNAAGTRALFFGAGGGAGLIDSRGVRGGQGQDFTLNWFIRGGVEHVTAKNIRLSAGILFQHLSNGGQTNPNPGIDALGFTVGYGWSY